jgi:hypothetical protein
MVVLETEYEKKSFTITTVLFILLFLFMLFFIIYPLPGDELKEEGGGGGGEIAINFGNSATGSGNNYQSKDLNVASTSTPQVKTPEVKQILTQNTVNAPVVSQTKTPIKAPTPKVVTPKPSKSTTDALSNLLNGNNKGDGNGTTAGNQGASNGTTSSTSYNGGAGNGTGSSGGNGSGQGIGTGSGYGSGNGSGSGSGNGNYQLGNRKALSKPQPNYTCNEQGIVAVQITVDQSGNVIAATAGVKGTTNTARCLLDQAELAAKKTKWEADSKAPIKQVGKIIYNFKLTD